MTKEFSSEVRGSRSSIHKEAIDEVLGDDPVEKRCRFVSFVSRSRGRGKRRPPREVNLLVVDKKFAYQVKEGEMVRRKSGSLAPDVLALEILGDIAEHSDRTATLLLERAIRNTRMRGK